MRIVLDSWEDQLEVVTSKGTSLHIRPVEIKKQLGVAGTTDQLELTTDLPVRIGKPFERSSGEDQNPMAVQILVGADHWAEVEPTDLVEEEDENPEEWLLKLE